MKSLFKKLFGKWIMSRGREITIPGNVIIAYEWEGWFYIPELNELFRKSKYKI